MPHRPLWIVVPAAGVGSRMGAGRPKQYLPLLGRTVIEWTLDRLAAFPGIQGMVVVVSPEDREWSAVETRLRERSWWGRVKVVPGGRERVDSVRNALAALCQAGADDDWVLVHDVARPCVRHADIARLIEAVGDSAAGGLLAGPVADTMKRSNPSGGVEATVPRDRLWRAYTPQMFPCATLLRAIDQALQAGWPVTDESSAMEQAGHAPRLVQGHDDNIKLTYPRDLELAALFLQRVLREDGEIFTSEARE